MSSLSQRTLLGLCCCLSGGLRIFVGPTTQARDAWLDDCKKKADEILARYQKNPEQGRTSIAHKLCTLESAQGIIELKTKRIARLEGQLSATKEAFAHSEAKCRELKQALVSEARRSCTCIQTGRHRNTQVRHRPETGAPCFAVP